MALIMMIAANEEEKREKKEILLFKQKEQYISNAALQSNYNQVAYGLMAYNTYRIRGQDLSNYKIWHTATDLNNIIQYTHKQIEAQIRKKGKIHLLFYCVNKVDPNIVSYNLIISSNYPSLNIIIKPSKSLCKMNGNNDLYKKIYSVPSFIKNYHLYQNKLKILKKEELKNLHYETFGSIPLIMTKKGIYIRLLDHKRKELLQKN
jgi:hypothetical protein